MEKQEIFVQSASLVNPQLPTDGNCGPPAITESYLGAIMSMKSSLSRILVFLLCVIGEFGGQVIVEPLNQEVALAGEIRQVHGYGPPGYGEDKKTDSRITYWILALPTPVNVLCTPERPEWSSSDCKATNRLRLFFPDSPADNGLELKAKAMNGHKAVVTGILHKQSTLGEITPIYMNVTQIQSVDSRP
jgi:hypothetical protein